MHKILCIAGARPNFMKVAPLFKALRTDTLFDPILVHTGQHYDHKMSGEFLKDLAIPEPKHHLNVGSGSHAQQTGELMKRFEPVVIEEQPHAIIVVGDVNSTMACALVAKKLGVNVVHIEAGLRSFDRTMPEEINRLVTDAISDLLLVSEESGCRNLLAEGIPSNKIHLVGNLMIDSLRQNLEAAKRMDTLRRLEIEGRPYGVVTLHRPANVDSPAQFEEILEALNTIAQQLPLYFPVHPRTKARLENGRDTPTNGRLHFIEPLGYLDFLCLMSSSQIVLTDSGGIQEETTALGIPCLTLRNNTERPITIEEGTNILAGTTKEGILSAWASMNRERRAGGVPKYWDGQAAERCRIVLEDFFASESQGVGAIAAVSN